MEARTRRYSKLCLHQSSFPRADINFQVLHVLKKRLNLTGEMFQCKSWAFQRGTVGQMMSSAATSKGIFRFITFCHFHAHLSNIFFSTFSIGKFIWVSEKDRCTHPIPKRLDNLPYSAENPGSKRNIPTDSHSRAVRWILLVCVCCSPQ